MTAKKIEPFFKYQPLQWIEWYIKETGNSYDAALKMLKQKQIASDF